MKTYAWLTIAMSVLSLTLFGLVTALGVPLLTDPSPWLGRGTLLAALTGFGLLVGDIVLPVPASLIMIAHGALFGVALGTTLSLVGGVAAAAFGFTLGRRGRAWLHRLVPVDERQRVERLLEHWGELAVIVSRPIPILAESVAILAGTTALTWRRFLLAAAAGCVPAALIYALAGALAVTLDSVPMVFGLVMVVAGSFHVIGRWLRRQADPHDRASA